jgi:hypothetical protein
MKIQLKFKDKIIPGYFIDENGIIYDSENNIQETVIGRGRPCFKCKSVHCLVVHSFIGYKKGFDIHHLNEDKFDNRLENLIYLTRSEHISLHTSSRAISQKTKQKISGTLKGHTPWNKGKIFVNNGIINTLVFPDSIPAGFVKGRI